MTTQPIQDTSTRLRLHPETRGLGDSQVIDLTVALRDLRDEPHAAVHGHRQITMVQQGALTVILMAFDNEGLLPDHVTDGIVTIQVIEGALTVTVEGSDHVVDRSQVLVLQPGRTHSVRAWMPSAMLLTVYLLSEPTPAAPGMTPRRAR